LTHKLIISCILFLLFINCDKGDDMSKIFNIEMVDIILPGNTATFPMGGTKEEDENPIHEVTLTLPYAIGKYEITNKQFCLALNWAIEKEYAVIFEGDVWDYSKTYKYLGITNLTEYNMQEGIEIDNNRLSVKRIEQLRPTAELSADEFPVHGVTWYGACAFCNFLSQIKGLQPVYDLSTWECDWEKNGYRLPTETEWTYAAKGKEQYKFAWGNELQRVSCTFSGSVRLFSNGLTPVGFYDGTEKCGITTTSNASPLGVYDLTGNVWEWCWDWYGSSYYAVSPEKDPIGPENGETRLPWSSKATRLWRGGGLLAPPEYLRVDRRWSACPDQCYSETGFRVAQTLEE
jgi:formylglycine-generating enzyme required for sulfatase activity